MKYSDFNCEIKIEEVCYTNAAKEFTQINPYCVRLNSVVKVIKSLDSNKVWHEMTRKTDCIYYFKYFHFDKNLFSDDTILKTRLGEIKISDLTILDVLEYEPEFLIVEVRGDMSDLEIQNKIESFKPENLLYNLKNQMIETTHIFNVDYEKIDALFICEVGDFYTSTYDKLTFNEALEIFKKNRGQYINSLMYSKNKEYSQEELLGLNDSEILARLLYQNEILDSLLYQK